LFIFCILFMKIISGEAGISLTENINNSPGMISKLGNADYEFAADKEKGDVLKISAGGKNTEKWGTIKINISKKTLESLSEMSISSACLVFILKGNNNFPIRIQLTQSDKNNFIFIINSNQIPVNNWKQIKIPVSSFTSYSKNNTTITPDLNKLSSLELVSSVWIEEKKDSLTERSYSVAEIFFAIEDVKSPGSDAKIQAPEKKIDTGVAAAIGINAQGVILMGEAVKDNDKYKIEKTIQLEFFNINEGWRYESQSAGRDWYRKDPQFTADNENISLAGMACNSDYEISIRPSGNMLSSGYKIFSSKERQEYKYMKVDFTGLAVVFRTSDYQKIKINDKSMEINAQSSGSGQKAETITIPVCGQEIQIISKSGLSWKITTKNLPSVTDAEIKDIKLVYLYLISDKKWGEDIEIDVDIIMPDASIKLLNPKYLMRSHDHKDWFEIHTEVGNLFINAAPVTLHAPAGKYGFLTVKNGRFYFENSEKPVKFYGTTLLHNSKMLPRELSAKVAGRIASMGCNIVRLHNLDHYKKELGIFDRSELDEKTENFDKELIDNMDYLIYELKTAGVYIHLDGIVLMKYKKLDAIDDYEQLAPGLKAAAYLYNHKALLEKQKSYFSRLWTHYNPYTKLRYCDDPVFATAEIQNENNLFVHSYNQLPETCKLKMRELFAGWAKDNNIKAAWDSVSADISDQFKCEVMRDYYRLLYSHLRTVGVRIPVCGANRLDPAPIATVKGNEEMDFTSDHPYFHNAAYSYKINPYSPSGRAKVLSLAKIKNKPLVHNEWNACGTMEHLAVWMYQSAISAMAGHDGSYIFALYHDYREYDARHLINLSYAYDPGVAALFPAAAVLFIREDMTMPDTEYIYKPSKEQLWGDEKIFYGNVDNYFPQYSRACFFAGTSIDYSDIKLFDSKFSFQSAFISSLDQYRKLIQVGSEKDTVSLPDINKYPAVNKSGEFEQYWKHGYFLVKTKTSKWAIGDIGQIGNIDLGDKVSVSIKNVKYACLTLTSLDSKPVTESRHLYIAAVSYIETPEMVYDQNWDNPAGVETNSKIICQPVQGMLVIPGQRGLLTGKNEHNSTMDKTEIKTKNGLLEIPLNQNALAYEFSKEY